MNAGPESLARSSRRDGGDRNQLLAYVASLYYQGRRSQAEIAAEVGVSRSMVSRMLDDAHRRGLIDIRINWPLITVPELEQGLIETFGLRGARVIDTGNVPYDAMLQQLGMAASAELQTLLHDRMTISVAWGTALWETVQALPISHWEGIEVVQCIGAFSRVDAPADGPILAQLLAQRLGGRSRYLHAPLVVDSETLCQGLLSDSTIAETLRRAAQADVALVGVGTIDLKSASLVRAGYLSALGIDELKALGAVGDILARHYDDHGALTDAPIDRRIIGLSLDDLKRIPIVLAVAGGEVKARALLGALRGRHLNLLVTDRVAATHLLAAEGVTEHS